MENTAKHPQDNPLLAAWEENFAIPPFESIQADHFEPAFEAAMAAHREELAAISHQESSPDFDNTIIALERSGLSLQRVINVFYNLTASNTSSTLQAVERDMAPRLAAHFNQMMLDQGIFPGSMPCISSLRHGSSMPSQADCLSDGILILFAMAPRYRRATGRVLPKSPKRLRAFIPSFRKTFCMMNPIFS